MRIAWSRYTTFFYRGIAPALYALIAVTLALLIYNPDDLKMEATSTYFVTSSTPTDNVFVNSESEFETTFALRNCTVLERFEVGIVKKDKDGSDGGLPVLESIFDDLNEAYMDYWSKDGFKLKKKYFDTNSELDDFVNDRDYDSKAICFAIAWHEFKPEDEGSYTFDLRWNHGEILAPRRPQNEYEESTQNQAYISQYGNTGFL